MTASGLVCDEETLKPSFKRAELCVCVCVCVRERERERVTERERERETDRQTERDMKNDSLHFYNTNCVAV